MTYAKITHNDNGTHLLGFYSSTKLNMCGEYTEDSEVGMQKAYWDAIEREFGEDLCSSHNEIDLQFYFSFLAEQGFIPASETFFYKP